MKALKKLDLCERLWIENLNFIDTKGCLERAFR